MQADRKKSVDAGASETLSQPVIPDAEKTTSADVPTVAWSQVGSPLGDMQTVDYSQPSESSSTASLIQAGVHGGYEILGELGRGGMGVVYKAFQKGLGRVVALKMVLAGNHADKDQLRRFIVEAKAVAQLQNPHIVQVFDIGENAGLPYFSLEYVDGPSLARRLERLPQNPEAAARMTEILARTMAYAHDHGVLHRDLKPANILLTSSGVPKIADFGLAKHIEDADDGGTRTGTVMGTPSYMAPEQALGDVRTVGPAADQYALGAILYEMLTGRPPFVAARAYETILQVIQNDPIPPRQLVPRIPKDLETICLRALQKDPKARYGDCSALAEDLARFLAGIPIQARPVSAMERSWRWCRRNPVVSSLAGTAVTLLVAIAIGSSWMASVLSAKNSSLEAATTLAKNNAEEANRQTEEAVRRSDRLKQVIQKTMTEVNRINIMDNPGVRDYVRNTHESMIPLLEEIVNELPLTDQAEPTLASGIREIALAYREQGNSTAAETKYRELVEFGRRRLAIKGQSDAARRNLSLFLMELANVRLEANRNFDEHLLLLQEAQRVAQDIVDNPTVANDNGKGLLPFYQTRAQLGEAMNRLATAQYRLGRPAQAKALYEQAIGQFKSILEAIPSGKAFEPNEGDPLTEAMITRVKAGTETAISTIQLASASVLYRTGEKVRALELLRKVLSAQKIAFEADPVPSKAVRYAGYVGVLAEFESATDRADQFLKEMEAAGEIVAQIYKQDPRSAEKRRINAVLNFRLAQWYARRGDTEKAKTAFAKSLAMRRISVDLDPPNDRKQLDLFLASAGAGDEATCESLYQRYSTFPKIDNEMRIDLARGCARISASAAEPQKWSDRSIGLLRAAVDKGFRDPMQLELEFDFDALRDSHDYEVILSQASSS